MLTGSFKTKPLLKAILPFFLGLGIGWHSPNFPPFWFAAAVSIFLALMIVLEVLKSSLFSSIIVYLLLFLCGISFGSVKIRGYINHPLLIRSENSPSIQFEAVVIDEALNSDDKTFYLVKIKRSLVDNELYRVKGKVWLSFDSPPQLTYGDLVVGQGVLNPLPRASNPGAFDSQKYSRNRGIAAVIECDNYSKTGAGGSRILRNTVLPIRIHLSSTIDRYIGGEEGDILKALVLGVRSEIGDDFKRELRKSGLWHLLSLSGLHIGIVAGILFFFLTALRIPGKYRWILVVIGVWIFCIIAQTRAPMVRASIILSLLFLSRYLNRYFDLWNLLALSALAIVIIAPGQLFTPGFQLSYAAAASILALSGRLYDVVKERTCWLKRSRSMKYILGLFIASLAASMGTAPLLAYHFGGIPFASIFASVVGVPLTAIILMVFPLFYGLTFILPFLAEIFAHSLWLCLNVLEILVETSANSGFFLPTPDFNLWDLLFLEIPLFLLLLGKRQWLWTALVAANVFLWRGALTPASLRLTFLDVGQGNSAVLELPQKECILIDAGPADNRFDAGKQIILPYFDYRGIERVNLMILTHPDKDHIGGAESVAANFPVDKILLNSRLKVGKLYNNAEIIRRGDWRKVDGVLMLFLNPDSVTENDNASSIVTEVYYGENSLLFPADIPAKVEKELLRYQEILPADILAVSHHGSKYSTTPEFLNAVKPKFAVISCGRNNPFGHPAPEALIRLLEAGAGIYRTDDMGAVCFKVGKDRVSKVNWNKKY